MHLPSGRAVKAIISIIPVLPLLFACLIFVFVLSSASILCSAQPKAEGEAKPSAEPTPPKDDPSAAGQKLAGEIDKGVVITNTDLITLTVTVTDTYGRFVSGLTKGAFTVLDQKKPQEITFFSDDDSPVSVGVIFDVSGSMSGDKVRRARDALSKFIQTSHNSDEYFSDCL